MECAGWLLFMHLVPIWWIISSHIGLSPIWITPRIMPLSFCQWKTIKTRRRVGLWVVIRYINTYKTNGFKFFKKLNLLFYSSLMHFKIYHSNICLTIEWYGLKWDISFKRLLDCFIFSVIYMWTVHLECLTGKKGENNEEVLQTHRPGLCELRFEDWKRHQEGGRRRRSLHQLHDPKNGSPSRRQQVQHGSCGSKKGYFQNRTRCRRCVTSVFASWRSGYCENFRWFQTAVTSCVFLNNLTSNPVIADWFATADTVRVRHDKESETPTTTNFYSCALVCCWPCVSLVVWRQLPLWP